MKRTLFLAAVAIFFANAGQAQCTIRFWNAFEVGEAALHSIRDTIPHVLVCVMTNDDVEEFIPNPRHRMDKTNSWFRKMQRTIKGNDSIMEVRCGPIDEDESGCMCKLGEKKGKVIAIVLKRNKRRYFHFKELLLADPEVYEGLNPACRDEFKRNTGRGKHHRRKPGER